ncbi:MAG TPA: OB-fold domain-containing protein [Mycobacteriales bacterium]|jgi:3-hydroxy-3-methylglutaryl CoA synthase|nr:OB-fold domain-containing protein [Mycobacteriales bacterium]
MRGILGWGVHLPHRRLDRTQIAPIAGGGGGKGTRTAASYDEDTTTMAVQAARDALRGSGVGPATLWFATAAPAYLDKTNATAVHAALRLDRETAAYDALGSTRSVLAGLRAALDARTPSIVIGSDLRIGLPGGPEESTCGDAAAAVVVGDDSDGAPVLAEVIGRAGMTEEFLDRWRVPGDPASRTWEERFGETKYVPLAQEALKTALGAAGLDVDGVDLLAIAGLHERACASVAKKSGVAADRLVDRMSATVGNPGVAQPLLLLASALEKARPGQVVVLLTLADGAEALVVRATDAIASHRPARPVAAQVAGGSPVSYGRYLAWRGLLPVEPPRRPEPARPSASAAGRTAEWKFGLSTAQGVLADQRGTVTTFTIDKLAYSPSPPVVFAVVDFDDGERLPVELTDVDAGEVAIGMRVEMTFRRLFTADGIANYFWKARPVRGEDA